MIYRSDSHRRRSIRLPGYDYAQAGLYFVTVCTQGRQCLFGEVVDGEMRLNEYGEIVAESWSWLSEQYSYVDLDAAVVMPNHFHGIIVFTVSDTLEGSSSRIIPMDSTLVSGNGTV